MASGVDVDETAMLFTITVAGDLDIGTVPGTHDAIQKAGRAGSEAIAFDLDGLTSMDEAALGILTGAIRTLSAQGRPVWIVCNIEPLVERMRNHGLFDSATLVRSLHDISSS
jgi:anti-anti-sigma factor